MTKDAPRTKPEWPAGAAGVWRASVLDCGSPLALLADPLPGSLRSSPHSTQRSKERRETQREPTPTCTNRREQAHRPRTARPPNVGSCSLNLAPRRAVLPKPSALRRHRAFRCPPSAPFASSRLICPTRTQRPASFRASRFVILSSFVIRNSSSPLCLIKSISPLTSEPRVAA